MKNFNLTGKIKMSSEDVVEGLKQIKERFQLACEKRPESLQCIQTRLVAVSKTKPIENILAVYEAGQRHFGENYIHEIIYKALHKQVLEECKDIKWHFIGHLQKNKVSKIINIPGLFVVETVHSEKLANALEKAKSTHDNNNKLKVFVQVNTSGEEEKNGISPSDCVKLTSHILSKCPHLEFGGLMTIGKFGYDLSQGPNPDFQVLLKCKDEVCNSLNLSPQNVEVSMGMSDDFEHAISVGSTNVRVGSSIFGYRPKTAKFSYLSEQHTDT